MRYAITNEDIAAEYFMVNEVTGELSVKKGLYLDEEQNDAYSVSLKNSSCIISSTYFLCNFIISFNLQL